MFAMADIVAITAVDGAADGASNGGVVDEAFNGVVDGAAAGPCLCIACTNNDPAVMAESEAVVNDLCRLCPPLGLNYLKHLTAHVKAHKHKQVVLPNVSHHRLRIGGLNQTIYHHNTDELEAWENFYIPDITHMAVLGVLDNFPSLAVGLQLIIMAGEDGGIYAYENEVLHLVAESLEAFFLTTGLTFPGLKIYNYGEIFDPMVL
ncbi:protein ORF125 [Lake sturgeon herpesvirus]|nr:protein ORF125 [Lake sturgeon herpesvirus]